MIAHKLMKMEGWKVYGYHADESDSMTDYYSPAYWNGLAEKNGYILCVNVYGASKPEEIRKYNHDGNITSQNTYDKIKKLEAMTVERGASEAEAETARNMIEKLQAKQSESTEKYIVTGLIPGHLANPPRCNWHIEKDGVIIAKGNGLLKYAAVDDYYRYDRGFKDLNKWKENEEKYIDDFVRDNMIRWNDTEERSRECALSHIEQMKKDDAIIQQFEAFINKIDTTCGGLLGDGDGVIYEKVKVTEYKKENKAIETSSGSLKDGQCFILKSSFNYGRYKGLVYRIHEVGEEGKKYFTAYKLNGKSTKECHGLASQNNTWYIGTIDNISKWIKKGSIAWCDIQEVKTPYEVEKVIKKTLKAEKKPEQKTTTEATEETSADIENLTFEVSEDTDTRTNEKIYLVKVAEKLSREDYIKVNQYIKSIGGYYSKFKHAFLFKGYPTTLLNISRVETVTEEAEKQTEATKTTTEAQQQEETTLETKREETKTMKFKANYISVNESTARTAKTINSFSEYKEGTATAEQKHYTDAIVNYANELLEKNPTDDTDKLEKVQYYIDSYSKKVAVAIDKSNRIDAMCPSVMTCGAGNFPTRRKEKQVAAMENHYRDTAYLYNTDDSNYYFKKIRTTLTDSGIIRSDDKNAVQMIKNKIERLEAEPDTYGNNKAEIRRLKGRLLQLAPEEQKKDIEITINGKEATFENIIAIFNESIPQKSRFSEDDERYYLNIPLCFSNGKRKYNEYLSDEVNADCTMLSTYGNRENNYQTIWKPLTDELKFMLIINKISGSGNKAVMYSILKDLIKKEEPEQEETIKETEENLPFKTVKNNDLMRLQLLFDGKPSEEIRTILKSNGFRWSPSNKAWQRLLNDNALYSLKRVSEAITSIA